jgi:chromosome partitioning protein
MRTICLAATKGGVGKTTLTAAMAVAAVADGDRVALIDADPQQSLTVWHMARDVSDQLVLMGERDDSVKARHDMARRGGFDWCLIDSPPAMVTVIEPCVRLADLVIIPVRPSPLDILAIDPIVESSNDEEKPYLFVLNQTTPRSTYTEQAAKLLRKEGTVYDGEIASRQSYAIAMVRGLTAPEVERSNGSARDEIEALWKVIKRRCPKGK